MLKDLEILLSCADALDVEQPRFDYPARIQIERCVFAVSQRMVDLRLGLQLQSLMPDQVSAAVQAACDRSEEDTGAVLADASSIKQLLSLVASSDPYVTVEDASELIEGHQAVVKTLANRLRRFVEKVRPLLGQ